jgi:predicted nucleotidyltransferase
MSQYFDPPPLPELPLQRAFLQALVPCLASIEPIREIWLTGSLARGDADRWSSVDLCLKWGAACPESVAGTGPSATLLEALDDLLGDGNAIYDQIEESKDRGCLRGISLGAQGAGGPPDGVGTGGLLFEIFWTLLANEEGLGQWTDALLPLYLAEGRSQNRARAVRGRGPALASPDTDLIDMQLRRFWLLLAQLPAVVRRREQLAAHALLSELRALLIDLVVSLNGARRPQARARINQYLGPAQRDAFEKSLGYRLGTPGSGTATGFNWIGQAVSLVVLYRWYAPQLVQRHSLPYPKNAEETVLALLSAELENWPSNIATG